MNQFKKYDIPISVIMPAYNEERYIAESIQSILNQTFQDFELIIVDDGSTDRTFEIASSFEDPRVQVYRQQNSGPGPTRNKALSLAQGKYIALQDADDRSKPDRLTMQYEFLEKNSNYIAVGTMADYVDEEGVFIYEHVRSEHIPDNWKSTSAPVIHATVMFRKHVLKSVGGYPDISVSQDTLFLYEISRKGKMKNLLVSLYEYRVNPYAISRKSPEIKEIVREIIKEYMDTGVLNNKLVEQVKHKKSNQKQANKHYEYHLLLAKKYLWNNYNKSLSRKNSKLALNYAEGREYLNPAMLYLLPVLGEKYIKLLYRTFSKVK